MKTYLCGGINGLSDSACRDWREVAKSILETETLDPMRRDYRGRETECVAEIVEGDKADIEACDFVLANHPQPSVGTDMEILYAFERGKIVVSVTPGTCGIDGCWHSTKPPSPWLVYHSTIILHTVEDASKWINLRTK